VQLFTVFGSERQKRRKRRRMRGRKRRRHKLEVLEQLEQLHFSDKRIMKILRIDTERLLYLRSKLQSRLLAMADD